MNNTQTIELNKVDNLDINFNNLDEAEKLAFFLKNADKFKEFTNIEIKEKRNAFYREKYKDPEWKKQHQKRLHKHYLKKKEFKNSNTE
tara:strand:- start:299 stop:562 length:264 start_codon:yes stop_codon:yes gene_type:complete